ncbi:MAG: efflux RND transporter permease subunit [Gemmatimonadales bacterium]
MGIAGRVAAAWLHSKLTPLVTIASLAVGGIAIVATPREEEPQISVPMIDVMTRLPGADPLEVEETVLRPIERRMREIAGVEHVYGLAGEGWAMATVRFAVGEPQDLSVSKVHAKLQAGLDQLPPGVMPPLVTPHSIDDVPVLALTLHGAGLDAEALRAIAVHLEDELRTIPDVARTFTIGGAPRQVRVTLDPARLAATGVSAGEVVAALQGGAGRRQAGELTTASGVLLVEVGAPIVTAADAAGVIVASRGGRAIPLGAVATVVEAPPEADTHVGHADATHAGPAVTLALAKRPGANATTVTHAALERVEAARGRLIPDGVQVSVTRDYGETASEKASELILHLVIATLSVTVLIGLFLGWREALVVLVAVPVTLALTLFVYYLLGYTLNRITLFALIFSIGILVDDAIVVVENIYRHLSMGGRDPDAAALEGVDEVGNPTILATFTVIAAILPMAFVSGMMGPYMRPIPIGASAAMLASLGVAFIITPWLALKLLAGHVQAGTHEATAAPVADGRYARLMRGLLERPGRRRMVYLGTVLLLLGSMALLAVRLVQVKMLPFDNKSEFQVVLDFPEGTPLETTTAVADEVAAAVRQVPEVVSTETYAGTAAPFNFNGLVRHYFLRRGPNVADVQVNLLPKGERSRQSHEIAVAVRPLVEAVASRHGVRAKVAEIPPGPPVLSTLVAEVYGPDDATRMAAAERVRAVMEATPGVVDIDWSIEAPQQRVVLRVDRARAGAAGVAVEQVTDVLALGLSGMPVGRAAQPTAREPVLIVPRLGAADRRDLSALLALQVATPTGPMPLARFVTVDSTHRTPSRQSRNLRPLVYVTAEVAGTIESPVYAILAMNRALDTVRVAGRPIARYNAVQPEHLDELALKWDGEWQVTIEVFRDLGLAFAVVLLLIYLLVVGWFQSYTIPLVIMAPIPLTLVGILPGHAASGAFFTATSMIGMIALAGIIVRNSILLVDFIQLAEARGQRLEDAVIEAGAVRFRPIALTAAAVVIGGVVMVLDPIFQGLAVALMSGAIAATALTMVLVPLLYWELMRRRREEATP